MSGKDRLNSWVTNLKVNFVEKWFRKYFKQINAKIGWTNLVDKLGEQNGWKIWYQNCVEKLCENIVWKIVCKNGWESCTVFIVQCTVYNVHCTVYSIQCTMYIKVMLLSLWREPQCSSVWGVKLLARLLLCLTHQEDSRAIVGDLEMEWNLVVGVPKM